MIEALINYFQDKGFSVVVIEGALLIHKLVDGQAYRVSWWISHEELEATPREVLFAQANRFVQMIDDAIAEKAGD